MLIFSEEIKHDAQKYKKSRHVFPRKAQKIRSQKAAVRLYQLPWQMQFLLLWKGCLISLESFGMLISHKISLGRTVNAFAMPPIAGNKLLGKKIRHLRCSRFGVIVNFHPAGKVEAGMLVKRDVPFHAEQAYAHSFGFLQRIVEELQTVSFALKVRRNADGTESP